MTSPPSIQPTGLSQEMQRPTTSQNAKKQRNRTQLISPNTNIASQASQIISGYGGKGSVPPRVPTKSRQNQGAVYLSGTTQSNASGMRNSLRVSSHRPLQKTTQNSTVATTSLKGNLSITSPEILDKTGLQRVQAVRQSHNTSKVNHDKIRSQGNFEGPDNNSLPVMSVGSNSGNRKTVRIPQTSLLSPVSQ